MNNEVKDWQGRVIGYLCFECGEIRQSMWGTICNSCRSKHDESSKLREEIKNLTKAVNKFKSNEIKN